MILVRLCLLGLVCREVSGCEFDAALDGFVVGFDEFLEGLEAGIEGVELGVWAGCWLGLVGGRDEGLVAHALGLHLGGDGIDGGGVEMMELFEHAVEEEAVAEDVDLARDALGCGVDLAVGGVGERGIGLPIDELETVLDVLAGLVGG